MRLVTLSQLSLAGSSGIAEAKIPLWWADGSITAVSNTSGVFFQDGGTQSTIASTNNTIFRLSSTWNSSAKFAFECTFYDNSSGSQANVDLYDNTANSTVTTVSTTSNTATVIRSGQFTLIPGNSYAIKIRPTAGNAEMIDASLIIFPS